MTTLDPARRTQMARDAAALRTMARGLATRHPRRRRTETP